MSILVRTYDFTLGHLSGLYSLSPSQWVHDVETVFARRPEWVSGTELDDKDDWLAARSAAQKAGYRIVRFKGNWVAVRQDVICKGSFRKIGITVIPREELRIKGADRSLMVVMFDHKVLGPTAVLASHYPVNGRPTGAPSRRVNLHGTKLMARAIHAQMAVLETLGFTPWYGGDQNIDTEVDDSFFGAPVVVCWDEVKRYPVTLGRSTMDVIARLKSSRARCLKARAFTDKQLPIFSDHRYIEARYRAPRAIRRKAA